MSVSTHQDPADELLRHIDDFRIASQRLEAVVERIVAFANGCNLCEEDEERLLSSGLVRHCRSDLSGTAAQLECRAELDAAHDLIRRIEMGAVDENDIFGTIDDYDDLISGEMEIARTVLDRVPGDQRIVFVGAGAMPVTVAHVRRLSGRSVIGIDHDPRAADAASRLLQLASMNDVEVRHGEGTDLDVTGVAMLHVATMVDDKAGIVARGLACGIDYFLVRAGRSLCKLFYEGVDIEAVEALGVRLVARTEPGPGIKCQSFLFERI